MKVHLTLNGAKTTVESDGTRTLLEVLREDLGLTGAKYGCGDGDCLACTVLIDGKAEASCQVMIADVQGRVVQTIEGLARGEQLHPVQKAFIDAEAMQCGYCVPGMILTAVELLSQNPKPDDEAIIKGMNGNICRCCGYGNIVRAIRIASGREEKAQ